MAQHGLSVIDPAQCRKELLREALDDNERLRVMPTSYYVGLRRIERAMLGHITASYVLPTHELISALRERIAGRSAIEIASGNGLVAGALGIPATDNHLQAKADVAALYASTGQPTIVYGANVERLSALQAIAAYRPSVVVACWYTHRYNPARHDLGGSVYSDDEAEILNSCDEYLFVGNTVVHGPKPMMQRAPAWVADSPPYLFSRSNSPGREFVIAWRKDHVA